MLNIAIKECIKYPITGIEPDIGKTLPEFD